MFACFSAYSPPSARLSARVPSSRSRTLHYASSSRAPADLRRALASAWLTAVARQGCAQATGGPPTEHGQDRGAARSRRSPPSVPPQGRLTIACSPASLRCQGRGSARHLIPALPWPPRGELAPPQPVLAHGIMPRSAYPCQPDDDLAKDRYFGLPQKHSTANRLRRWAGKKRARRQRWFFAPGLSQFLGVGVRSPAGRVGRWRVSGFV